MEFIVFLPKLRKGWNRNDSAPLIIILREKSVMEQIPKMEGMRAGLQGEIAQQRGLAVLAEGEGRLFHGGHETGQKMEKITLSKTDNEAAEQMNTARESLFQFWTERPEKRA